MAAVNGRKNPARIFAALVLREHRDDGDPGDVDGGWIQETAEACGLIERFEVSGSCGGSCACDAGDYCFRLTKAGRRLMASLEPNP